MNPALFSALMMMLAPQLLGRLFGHSTAQERLRERMRNLFTPGALAKRADENQEAWYKSPSYGAAQASSLAAGRMAEASVSRAGAGVTSGMDILQGAAASGLGTATLGKFNADAYTQSRELAQRQAEAELNALMGGGMPVDVSREMAGASINALGPLLAKYFNPQAPQSPQVAGAFGADATTAPRATVDFNNPNIFNDPAFRRRPRTYFAPNRPNY
jgi:hypothetical protein